MSPGSNSATCLLSGMWPASLCTLGAHLQVFTAVIRTACRGAAACLLHVIDCKVQGLDVACLPCQKWLARQVCRSQHAAPVEGLPSRCCASTAAADGQAHSIAEACIRPVDNGSPGKCGWPAGPPMLQLWRAWHWWRGTVHTCWTSTTMSSMKSWSWQVSCGPGQHALSGPAECTLPSLSGCLNSCDLVDAADKAAHRASLS